MPFIRTRFLDSTLRSPLFHLPVRSVVFELDDARLLLSPGSMLSPEQLSEAGPLSDIVAPNLMHTGGMNQAAESHPQARLWGPVGVREKHPELQWQVLGESPWPFESELSLILVPGMPKLNESAFVHHASKALYLTDMAFHIREPDGLAAGLFFRVFGTYRRFAVSKLFLRYVKDRKAFEAALHRMMRQEFEHVVVSHGDVLENEGKARLLAAFNERGFLNRRQRRS